MEVDALSLSERGTTLAQGSDWHAPRLALKKSKGIEGKALQGQGAGATSRPPWPMCSGNAPGGSNPGATGF